jgi:terminase small subunit-like protein
MSLVTPPEPVTPESNVTRNEATRNGAPLSNAERQRLYRQRQKNATSSNPAPTTSKPLRKISKARDGNGPKPPPTPILTAPPRSHSGRVAYSEEVMDEILRRLSHGETLRNVCASSPDFPAPATVIDWVHENRCGLTERYARARERQLEAWAEEVLDKADATSTEQGAVQRDRLSVDARKWLLSKLKPEKYGDRLDVTSAGKPLTSASDLDIAKALARALAVPALPAPEPIDVVATEVKEGES